MIPPSDKPSQPSCSESTESTELCRFDVAGVSDASKECFCYSEIGLPTVCENVSKGYTPETMNLYNTEV